MTMALPRYIQEAEARVVVRRSVAAELRAERTALMIGWADLVAASDYTEIERRSIRRGEIDQELAALCG